MRLTLIYVAGLGWTDWAGQDGDGWHATPLLWPPDMGLAASAATLATGALPERHGVVADDEAWPLGVRPVTQASWRLRPLWATLAARGMTVAIVDWPGSGGTTWPGMVIDDRYAIATGHTADDWAMPPGCTPGDLREPLRDLRIHPADLSGAQLLPLLPGVAAIDQDRSHTVEAAARALARAATAQAVGVHLLGNAAPDFLALHLALPADLRRMGDARIDPAGGGRFVRAAIDRLRAVAPDRAVVIAGHGLNGEAGLLVTSGLELDPVPLRATDVAAALTRLWDFAAEPEAAAPPTPGIHPIDQGYAPAPGAPAPWQASRLAALARMLLARAPATAHDLVQQALALDPANIDALRVAGLSAAGAGDSAALTELGERLRDLAPAAPWGPLALALAAVNRDDKRAAADLLAPLAGSDETTWHLIGAAWLIAGDLRRAEQAFAQAPNRTAARLGEAQIALTRRDFARAEAVLREAITRNPVSQPAYQMLGDVCRELGRTREAAVLQGGAERLTIDATTAGR